MKLLSAIGAFALLLSASAVQAITADELIAKNIEAKGGIDKIKAIETLKLEGKLQFSGGNFSVELGYVQYQKR
ncbi:MAG: hypothetical protein ABI451_09325, partial [Dokdonella sp.]